MDLKRLPNNTWLYRAVLVTWIASAIIVMFLLSKIDTIMNVEMYKHGLQFSTDWANPYWTYLNLNYIALGVPVALSLFALALGFTPKIKKVAVNMAEKLPRSQPAGIIPRTRKVLQKIAERMPRSKLAGIIPRIKRVFQNIAERLPRFHPKGIVPKVKKAAGNIAERRKKVGENIVERPPASQPVARQEQKSLKSSYDTSVALGGEEAQQPGTADFSCPSCGKTFGRPLVMLDFEGGKSRLVNVCPYCSHVLGSAESEKSSGIDVQVADLDEELKH